MLQGAPAYECVCRQRVTAIRERQSRELQKWWICSLSSAPRDSTINTCSLIALDKSVLYWRLYCRAVGFCVLVSNWFRNYKLSRTLGTSLVSVRLAELPDSQSKPLLPSTTFKTDKLSENRKANSNLRSNARRIVYYYPLKTENTATKKGISWYASNQFQSQFNGSLNLLMVRESQARFMCIQSRTCNCGGPVGSVFWEMSWKIYCVIG